MAESKESISFDELGTAIDLYGEADGALNSALFINQVHDDPDFSTISGEELEKWKQEFPRIDDEEVARLRDEFEIAEEKFLSDVGLESIDVIPALMRAYQDEVHRRKLQTDLGADSLDPQRTAISVEDFYIRPRDKIMGTVIMANLTDETYRMHAGIKSGAAYGYMYATVEPVHEVDDVIAQFSERGLEVAAATSSSGS